MAKVCHRKSDCLSGMTPQMASSERRESAPLVAIIIAADEDKPSAQTAPRPKLCRCSSRPVVHSLDPLGQFRVKAR